MDLHPVIATAVARSLDAITVGDQVFGTVTISQVGPTQFRVSAQVNGEFHADGFVNVPSATI
jgi:hypothetical protein